MVTDGHSGDTATSFALLSSAPWSSACVELGSGTLFTGRLFFRGGDEGWRITARPAPRRFPVKVENTPGYPVVTTALF